MSEKKREKLVTAVITTHNRPPSIVTRAIKSVLRQTYNKIEIIVVDDSLDDYPYRTDVEKSITELSRKITYIKHEFCQGSCQARNTGLKYAKGFYIAFLDDDDEWHPEKIEKQIQGFVNNTIGLVYCGFIVNDEIKGIVYEGASVYKKGYIFPLLIEDNIIGHTSNPLIRRDCIEKVGGFDIEMESSQDYDLWLRIALEYPVNYVACPLLNYHIHYGECISCDIEKTIIGKEQIIIKYKKYIDRDNKTWYMRHKILIPLYARRGMKKKAFTLWIKCVNKMPLNITENMLLMIRIIMYSSGIKRLNSQFAKNLCRF